jgi:RNA polymerase sigma-70 factor, ECF subfamily
MIDTELQVLLEIEVERLPERYRSVIGMRAVEGQDATETLECLRIFEEAVKTKLHRAIAMMRRQLYTSAGVTSSELFSFPKNRCDRVVAAVLARILSFGQGRAKKQDIHRRGAEIAENKPG